VHHEAVVVGAEDQLHLLRQFRAGRRSRERFEDTQEVLAHLGFRELAVGAADRPRDDRRRGGAEAAAGSPVAVWP
jgi:hypothetical protein